MQHENTPENLADLFGRAVVDPESRVAFAQAVFPTEDTLAMALADGHDDVLAALVEAYDKMRPPEEAPPKMWFKVLDVPTDRTEVRVHGATASEIADAIPGTTAAKEFPGGAQKVAGLLDPGLTFYEVTATEPGASSGSRFHLFFWAGTHWSMLGPAWRVLR